MKNIQIFLTLTMVIVLFSCRGSGNKSADNSMTKGTNTIADFITTPVKLEPLINETLKLKDKDPFGKIIELKGEQVIIDNLIFKPLEVKMVIKDNYLVMKTYNKDGLFMLLSFPDLQLIKSFGTIGPGPDEFRYPNLCRNTEPDILATVVESTNGKIYDVLPDGTLRPNKVNIPKSKAGSKYAGEYPALMTGTMLYFAAN